MATTKATEKVGNKFLADSEIGRMYGFLSDGKAHSKEETIKAVKPKTGRIVNKTKRLQDWGKKSGQYTLTIAEDGALQIVFSENGGGKKTSKKSATTAGKAE